MYHCTTVCLEADRGLLVGLSQEEAIVERGPFDLCQTRYIVEGRYGLVHEFVGPGNAGDHAGGAIGRAKEAVRLDNRQHGRGVAAIPC